MDCVNSINLFFNKLFKNRLFTITLLIFSIFLFNPIKSNAQVTFGEVGVAFADSSGNVLYEVDKNDYNIELNVQNVKYILMYTNSSTIKNNGYNLFYDFAIGYQGMQYPVGINVTQLLENRNSIQFTPSLFNVEGQVQGAQGYYSRYHLNMDFIASSSNAWYQVTLQLPTEMNFTFYSVYNKKFTQTSGNSGSQIESSAQDIIDNQDKNTQEIIDTILDDDYFDKSELEQYFITIKNDIEQSNPVSDLLLMPITLLNAYNNGISNACSPINLGNLLGTDLIMPCIDIRKYLGSELYSLIDILFSVFLFYEIAMLCISIFESITTLDDGFQLLYSPKHGDMSRVGRGHSRGLY